MLWVGHTASTWGQSLGAERDLCPAANKKMGPSLYNCKVLNSANNLDELWKECQDPKENATWPTPQSQPPETLSREPSSTNVQPSDLQQLWHNKWVFVLSWRICGDLFCSNRKLVYMELLSMSSGAKHGYSLPWEQLIKLHNPLTWQPVNMGASWATINKHNQLYLVGLFCLPSFSRITESCNRINRVIFLRLHNLKLRNLVLALWLSYSHSVIIFHPWTKEFGLKARHAIKYSRCHS